MPREVLITGVGLVSPAGGRGVQANWEALLAGRPAVRPVSGLDLEGCATSFAGQVSDFVAPVGLEHADRLCQFAVAAADDALASAGLTGGHAAGLGSYHCKVSIGTSKGGIESFARLHLFFPKVPKNSNIILKEVQDIPPDAPARQVAARWGVSGGVHATVGACATGTLAVIRGANFIADGQADLVLAGAADASLHRLWFAAFEQMGLLARAHPQRGPGWACRPFDRTREGFALGEGAAVLVLESAALVARRRAQPIARLAGWACGTDPVGLTQVSTDGRPLAHAITVACGEAGCRPAELSCIHAHGTGTPANDRAETAAIRQALGEAAYGVPIVSIKGAIGHLLGAAGAVELAVAALACQCRRSPGTATLLEPDPDLGRLALPTAAFDLGTGPVLKTALGFGGHVAAVVLTRP